MSLRKKEGFVPLLNESIVTDETSDEYILPPQRLFEKCPYEDAGILSKIFFSWVSPVIQVYEYLN